MEIISRCDFVFRPQRSVKYLAVSPTARMPAAMGVPVVITAARQFQGLQDCTYVLVGVGLDGAVNRISDPRNRRELSERAIEHARSNSIRAVYESLLDTRQSVMPRAPEALGSIVSQQVSLSTSSHARLPFLPVAVKVAILRARHRAELAAARLGLWPKERVLRRFGG